MDSLEKLEGPIFSCDAKEDQESNFAEEEEDEDDENICFDILFSEPVSACPQEDTSASGASEPAASSSNIWS